MRQVFFRRQTRDGVFTSRHTVTNFCMWQGGDRRLTGWGFSTTQQPSLCQNSLIFPDGSSFGPLPEAPEGTCFVANQPVLTLRRNSTLDSHSWMVLGLWEP